MDSIRASTNTCSQDDMSYLFARDPSILAYGQRPCVSKETKKNLLSSYEVEEECTSIEGSSSIHSDLQSLQTVKVYLRLKPFPKKLKLTQEQLDAYKIISPTTLSTTLPALDNNTSCLKRSCNSDIIRRKFTFTKTFGPETTQLELFEQAVKQHMIDFLAGQNSTIMTYGTTNSGKSYTLQGTTTSPGIIPRCLEFVFTNITPKSVPSYKPMNHCDVVSLDPLERAQELEIKTKLLTFASVDKHQYINAYKEMQKLLREESPIRPSQCVDAHYSVWVSFAEIYNEIVYDLLSNECQKKRTPLKLATDGQGRAFIKGLKNICVNSGSEAYQVLMAGQYNLKVAATALNARSSRSHCIFTIKLLKYYIENNPESVDVSTFTFCDLAGSERLKKTLNIGDRLKEAQNINTSLLVLGRCLKTIHEGQVSKQKIEHIGPFRESKLTRLFQKALSGKEHIALIVNINPLPNLYVETQNVLNFSAIAKKIVIEQKEKVHKKKSRFSQIVTQSIKTVTNWDTTELESEDWHTTINGDNVSHYVQAEHYEELLSENEQLKKEIASLKNSALTRDLQIRQEMADTYTAMIKDLETEWKNRIKDVEEQQEDVLQWSIKNVEEFYKQKLNQISSRKKRRQSVDDDLDDNLKNIEELEIENSRLTSKIVVLQNSVKELKETNQNLVVEKNKINFELGIVKEDLKNVKNLLDKAQEDIYSDEDTKCYIEELKSQLFAKQEQVKKLKVFLNEAKEEYIAITTEVVEKDYIIKEQEKELLEKQEVIEDLEADFESINICLTEKTKTVEVMEEKMEIYNRQIIDTEITMKDLQHQVNKLESEKTLLQNEVELLKKLDLNRKSMNTSDCKNDILEVSQNSLKSDEHKEIKNGDISCDLNFEILEKTYENDKKGTEEENEEPYYQMKEKIMIIEAENSTLKQKLTQSTTEIQSLKEELGVAKLKLQDISDQVFSLYNSKNSTEKFKTDSSKSTESDESVDTVEVGCQVNIEPEEEPNNTQNEVHNRSCQVNIEPEEEEVHNRSCQVNIEWEEADVHNRSCQTIECVMKEESNQTSFTEENDVHNRSCQTIEYVTKEESNQTSFSEEVDNDDTVLNDLAKLTIKYDDMKSQYKEKCLCLDIHIEKITELEKNLESFTELQQRIQELRKTSEMYQAEKEHLQKLYEEYKDRISELEDRLEHAEEKEREKDDEISSLQKEMKHLIQKQDNDDRDDKLMETEMKNTIRDLAQTKELLLRREEHIEDLEMRLKQTSEQNAKILDLLQQSAQERQAENERLRTMNEELKNSLIEKEREMEAFMKNRDEMVTKYEDLVKTQQDELEKQKREVYLLLNYSIACIICELTFNHYLQLPQGSEIRERRIRRPPKRYSPRQDDDTSVIELSGSESKRIGKRTVLPPPVIEITSETKKKGSRRKKLFSNDESFQDIEPQEEAVPVTPSLQSRSLRSRRK
ncbi:uncharacterized protein LOC143181206 [Calliopsis andreniformis]|uniref:uncharacterized protein LOC143181206 n=1 Tax=Calliopsis andreniformis TaxID=337506 RepID=UPI003FCC423F